MEVPRFRVTWGTGPSLIEPFVAALRDGQRSGLVELQFRHRVDRLTMTNGAVDGVAGVVLAPDECERGASRSRDITGEFELRAPAVIVSSGGIGGNPELVRASWPARLGAAPTHMLSGVPAHVDGRMIGIAQSAGGRVINPDRMWLADGNPVPGLYAAGEAAGFGGGGMHGYRALEGTFLGGCLFSGRAAGRSAAGSS